MYAPWVKPFLDALADTGIVTDAALAAGITTSAAYGLKAKDADFAAAWELAREDAADTFEREAIRRAVVGVQEPVVYQGQLTPVWARNSDGTPVMESYEVTKDGKVEQHQRPVQALDANGQPVWLTVTKHSDSLLALLLKGRRKKVFAERTEITGADGAPVAIDEGARAARAAQLLAIAMRRKTAENEFSDLA